MNKNVKPTKKQEMLEKLAEQDGIVSEALLCVRATFKDHEEWLSTDSNYALRVREIREAVKDKFIRAAIRMADNNNAQVVVNVLKTLCKDRGYGADGESPITSEIVEIGFTDEN